MAGMVDAKAMDRAGYRRQQTGGGLTAWERTCDNGDSVRVSYDVDGNGGSADGDPDQAAWHVIRQNDDIGYVQSNKDRTLADALAFAAVIPSPGTGDAQVDGDTVEEIQAALASEGVTP